MVAMGDSLTDIGTREFFPPCVEDSAVSGVFCDNPRSSDGPLLVDYLVAYYDLPSLKVGFPGVSSGPAVSKGGNNFARASAVARLNLPGGTTNTLQSQVNNYKVAIGQAQSTTVPGFQPNLKPPTKKTLHALWFGSNDLFEATLAYILSLQPGSSVPRAQAQNIIDAGILGLMNQLEELYKIPNVCNVLVLGPIDGSLEPASVLADSFYSELNVLQTTRDYSVFFNNEVGRLINGVLTSKFNSKCTSASFGIKFINTVDLMDRLFRDNPDFPEPSASCNDRFRTSKAKCLVKGNTESFPFLPLSVDDTDVLCAVPVVPNLDLDCSCDEFLYYDELYASSTFHEMAAEEVTKILDDGVCSA